MLRFKRLLVRLRLWYPEEFRYGDNHTIHRTGHLDVETDKEGQVVAVWFRCYALPFRQCHVDDERAENMRDMYESSDMKRIKAVVVE